ncbi:MAG: hypothetical protein NT136_01700 [Candidatus Moranbacteria bacterium]|nr:hypothetical protein [Candidatus Moranbacteria bacterium]
MTKNKIIIIALVLAALLVAIFLVVGGKMEDVLRKKDAKNQEVINKTELDKDKAEIYEALVEVKGGEAGDVIAVLPAGHEWSETEETSYLILKIKLTLEDAAKLTKPETKPSSAEASAGKGNKNEREMRPPTETIRARAYRLKIETLNFNPDEIWKGQPYADKIFDKDLIQKK